MLRKSGSRLSLLFQDFFQSETSSSVILIFCTVVSILLATFYTPYIHVWEVQVGALSVEHWVNDGLMSIFFLMIGLELEREVYKGELSSIKDAALPVAAAVGGMLVPAFIYFLLNQTQPFSNGFGIPMATDIAFALGILSLMGKRVPASLKIFLTALAVIDDLGAILCIALFYSKNIHWIYLAIAGGIMLVLFLCNRMKIKTIGLYLLGGIGMWYCFHHSGIHATLSGILLAFVIPFEDGSENSVSYRLQHVLHKPVAYVILPVFALCNTAIPFSTGVIHPFQGTYNVGVFLGLVLGKPIGITLATVLFVKTKLASWPSGIRWQHILACSFLGGIGFTMSVFITLLAFNQPDMILEIKWTIIISSATAAGLGYLFLSRTLKQPNQDE
ncbi:MAG: Na+/H+ antiporter NhaA [Chitinophagaceae bacterium]|nr:Na+/H+ antiporter NhaA [Chitinophagaceae bacterium]